jgi:hypothetical protein
VLTGDIQTHHLDLAVLLERPSLSSDITGHVNAQATIPAQGGPARLTFQFAGPGSRALGYTAERIEASGEVVDGAVTFDFARVGVRRECERARQMAVGGETGGRPCSRAAARSHRWTCAGCRLI